MARLLFEKSGNAVWISHLDLMRLFQRAFKRAGLPLKHTQGFNPRPSVSIALPLSVGVASRCELLDFEIDGVIPEFTKIRERLNSALTEGIRVLEVYENGRKLRDLSLLRCEITLEYDNGVEQGSAGKIMALFQQQSLPVLKKTKSGPVEQDIISMIHELHVSAADSNHIMLQALICCQNPTLNPMQLVAAITNYLPQYKPDYAHCCRLEIYDSKRKIFR